MQSIDADSSVFKPDSQLLGVKNVGQLGLAVGLPAEEVSLEVQVVPFHPGVGVSQSRDDDDPKIFTIGSCLSNFRLDNPK